MELVDVLHREEGKGKAEMSLEWHARPRGPEDVTRHEEGGGALGPLLEKG